MTNLLFVSDLGNQLPRLQKMAKTIMEPSTAGIMAVPAIIGPQVPKSKWPIKAPIQPRNIFPKHPIRSPRLVRVPAKNPTRRPTNILPNILSP